MQVIASWTGRHADALRQALRMTNESFAEHLGVAVRTVAYWRKRPAMVPLPAIQEALDTVLERAPDRAKAQFALLIGEAYGESSAQDGDDIGDLLAAITATGITDDAIEQVERAVDFLAESHTHAPAHKILDQVMPLHRRVRSFLSGKHRLSQERELYRIESLLLSHACLLLGDLDENARAERYGEVALTDAREAGSDQAVAMTVLAKTFRWQNRLMESMDMARRGFECSPNTPIRMQLASQEANAAALLGDTSRAREALGRAAQAAETAATDSGLSAWSFPIGRQAIFALSVATQISDTDGMLQAAAVADAAWSAGAPKAPANWAQIRVGAAKAYLMKGSLDGTVSEVEPVLSMPPGMRVATVTAYTENLARLLERPRHKGTVGVRELGERLSQFKAGALQDGES
jgi:transcriptional regulator with XRE-family HTH domain